MITNEWNERVAFSSEKEKSACLDRWNNAVRVLTALTPHERRKHFDMSNWGQKTACGTVACAAGFCGLDPWFRRRGLKLNVEIGSLNCDPDTFFIYGGKTIFYTSGTHGQVLKRIKRLIRRIEKIPVG